MVNSRDNNVEYEYKSESNKNDKVAFYEEVSGYIGLNGDTISSVNPSSVTDPTDGSYETANSSPSCSTYTQPTDISCDDGDVASTCLIILVYDGSTSSLTFSFSGVNATGASASDCAISTYTPKIRDQTAPNSLSSVNSTEINPTISYNSTSSKYELTFLGTDDSMFPL